MVSFTPPPLYPRGKRPRSPSDRKLGGPQSRSGRRGEGKILDPTGTRTPLPRSSSPKPVSITRALSRFSFKCLIIYTIKLTAVQTSEAGLLPCNHYRGDCSLGLFLVERELKI
jgi:hypothetical protein